MTSRGAAAGIWFWIMLTIPAIRALEPSVEARGPMSHGSEDITTEMTSRSKAISRRIRVRPTCTKSSTSVIGKL